MIADPLPVQTFIHEAHELLDALEEQLLELEADRGNEQLIDAVFRSLHTLKGSGEMFGFSALASFAHAFENAYDAVRSRGRVVTDRLIDVSLRSHDHIGRLIGAGADEAENARLADDPQGRALLSEIEALQDDADSRSPGMPDAPGPPAAVTGAPAVERTWHIRFRPERSAFRNGMRPDLLIEELAALGTCTVGPHAAAVPPLEDIDPAACYLVWEGDLRTSADRGAIEDIFLFAEEGALNLWAASEPGQDPGPREAHRPGRPSPGETPAMAADAPSSPDGERIRRAPPGDSIRVQSHRLDQLMDRLGELVIAQARLTGIARRLSDPALIGTAEEIERLIAGLRDTSLSIRMLPIGTVFSKFRRVVHDLSAELGKTVTLATAGEDTELDKNVIDRLSEPLVHILRNAIDHGIEPAAERLAQGKPATATVSMSARQAGREVLVTVSDDGGGLRTGRIRERAIERGLVSAADALSDDQINQLIFMPGFSTAATVSSVSGRGVGMDAVRTVVADLGGAVEVAAAPGEGTDITLRLPLTLAIIEGLLVRIGGEGFVIPLASVDECVELRTGQATRESGRRILTIRDELVPFIDLATRFGLKPVTSDGSRRIVIVCTARRRVGLVVDEIVGQHQTVIKSLGPYHRGIPGLAGSTILGDGSVALILDPQALVRCGQSQATEAA